MNKIIKKTLGGLDSKYYFRSFLFGLIFLGLFYVILSQAKTEDGVLVSMSIFAVVSTLLYPYSRFVYEQIMDFIFGKNIFFVNAKLFLAVKFMTMYLCWGFAVFIAPIGVSYLYFYHTKNETNKQSQAGE